MDNKKLQRFMTQAGVDELPVVWQKAIAALYGSYPSDCLPCGICDPVYIANILARNLGLGDGKGNFNKDEVAQ